MLSNGIILQWLTQQIPASLKNTATLVKANIPKAYLHYYIGLCSILDVGNNWANTGYRITKNGNTAINVEVFNHFSDFDAIRLGIILIGY